VLCSRCNRNVQPIVAFDLDGVLGDYHEHFHRFAEQYLRRRIVGEAYDGSIPHREWWRDHGVPVAQFRDIKLAYRQGGMKRSQPPNKPMIDGIRRLKRRGVEIWITTTRPYLRLDNVDPDTRFWLEHNGIEFDHLMYDDSKYQKLAAMVDRARVAAIVDDDGEMYDDAEDVFGVSVPILYRHHYNRGVSRSYSARSANEAYDMVRQRVERWERRFG
jgi:hypothetical protein